MAELKIILYSSSIAHVVIQSLLQDIKFFKDKSDGLPYTIALITAIDAARVYAPLPCENNVFLPSPCFAC